MSVYFLNIRYLFLVFVYYFYFHFYWCGELVIDVSCISRMVGDDGRNQKISKALSTNAAVPTFSFWHSS